MNGLIEPNGRRLKSFLLFSAAVSMIAGPAFAQAPVPAQKPVAKPPVAAPAAKPPAAAQPGAPVPANPSSAPGQPAAQAAPAPPPLPPVVWDLVSAQDLLYYVKQVGKDGLNPADYDPDRLLAAIQSGNPMTVSPVATEIFNRLSSDLALGHVRKPARIDWHLTDDDLNPEKQDALLRSALAQHSITAALNGLLPTHPQYAALKLALETTPVSETSKIGRIKLNMDRWRWLPRDLGQKYVIVNVPSFHATLVEDGVNRWKQRAIAGKLSTPTPQLNAMAVGVILNPTWEVPESIAHEAAGKKGFVAVKDKNGKFDHWRQLPGPNNALGQLKFVMYNPYNIYLHDTNARSRFNSDVRALSHGCVRTQHIVDLATELLGDDGGEWTPEKIQAQLASGKTKQANFVKPVPVYIVYFSSAALLDGRIVQYKDMYNRDTKAMQALAMKDGGASLATAKPKPEPKPEVAGQSKKAEPKAADKAGRR